jgi:hypothetical protein
MKKRETPSSDLRTHLDSVASPVTPSVGIILNQINAHISDKGKDYIIDPIQTVEEQNEKYIHADTNMDRTSFIPIFNREIQTLEPMTSGPVNIEQNVEKDVNYNVEKSNNGAMQSYADNIPTNMGSTLLDKSLEGSVEMDYLGYKPPGHIISHLYDKSDHYTVNVNACLGKIVSDDVFITELHGQDLSESKHYQQCGQHDVNPINALNGRPEKMLDCDGDCYSISNYTKFYNKFLPAIHDSDKFNYYVN